MLVVLILSVSLSISDATINELVSASEHQVPMTAQNLAPPFPNDGIANEGTPNNLIPTQSQVPSNPQNGVNCPNTSILLNLVNILINSLHQDDKTILDPEKFKYLLTVVKNFLETTPSNLEHFELRDKFQNIEANPININRLVEKPNFRALDDNPTAKTLQYDWPNTQRNQNCKDILDNIMNSINTAAQILKYCLATEECNIKNLNNITSGYNRINPFYPYAPIQRNSTSNIWLFQENLPKESFTAGADLVNFIKSQKDQGPYDIMSMLANYKLSGASYPPAQQLKNPDGFQNLPYVAPGNNQAPSFYPPVNQMNGKNPNVQPSSTYVPPNMNTVLWQTTFPGLQGLTGKNQQFVQLFKKFYDENNAGTTSSSYPGVETLLQPTNGQIAPINTGIPSADQRVFTATNPSINMYPNQVIDILKQVVNPKQNLPQSENTNPNFVDGTPLVNMQQYLQHLQNLKMQPSIPQNILSHKPQQSMPGYVAYGQNEILNNYPANQPLLGVNNQFHQNRLRFNQIPPYLAVNTKYNNGQNMLTDNTKQGNRGGALFDLNNLLSVANLGKLNAIPNKNGIVELTYMLKRPKPVEESQYYVKYRMPYQTFVYNLQNLLIKKPNLRNEPNNLYQYLLVGSNVTDTPNDLKGLNYEDILKLTFTNGTLVTAKILDNNDTAVEQTLRFVQKLNSQLPVESLMNFSVNATKNIRMETQRNGVNGSSNNNQLMKNVYPGFFDVRRGLVPNLNYPFSTIGQYPPRLQYYPYTMYHTKPTLGNVGMPFLKNNAMPVLSNTNVLKNPTVYSPYLVRNPQFGR